MLFFRLGIKKSELFEDEVPGGPKKTHILTHAYSNVEKGNRNSAAPGIISTGKNLRMQLPKMKCMKSAHLFLTKGDWNLPT